MIVTAAMTVIAESRAGICTFIPHSGLMRVLLAFPHFTDSRAEAQTIPGPITKHSKVGGAGAVVWEGEGSHPDARHPPLEGALPGAVSPDFSWWVLCIWT